MTKLCAGLVLSLFLAGCATASIEDAVPAGALPQADNPAAVATGEAGEGAVDAAAATGVSTAMPSTPRAPTAGVYPNLNLPTSAAAPQITAEQKAAETAQLRARREQMAQQKGAGAGDQGAELRRLAATHGNEALKEIEGE